jgi:hypothetical protein
MHRSSIMGDETSRPPHFVNWDHGETWFQILPPDDPDPSIITREELLAVLRRAGYDIPLRTLRYWEYMADGQPAILPRGAVRRHRGRNHVVYPDWAAAAIARFRHFQQSGRPADEARGRLRNWLEALFAKPPEQRGFTGGAEWVVPPWLRAVDKGQLVKLMEPLGYMAMRRDIVLGARVTLVQITFTDEHGFRDEPLSFGISHHGEDTPSAEGQG